MLSKRKPHRKPYKPRNRPDSDGSEPAPISRDFIDETIAIWQPRTSRRLSREDAREIIENVTGFFAILQEWERAERAATLPPPSEN